MKRANLVILVILAVALALVPVSATADSTATRRVVWVPVQIDATGRHDVTGQLNEFFASLPPDTVVRFPRRARYRIEGTVEIVDPVRLALRGNESLFFATTRGDRSRAHLALLGGHDVTIRNLRIRGANPEAGTEDAAYVSDLEAQHGIRVHGTARIRIARVRVHDVFGDFVYLGRDLRRGPTYMTPSQDVVIRDSVLKRNGRQGIAITHAQRVDIYHNTIADVRRATFDLEPNGTSWQVQDITMRANEIGDGRLTFLSASGQGPVNNVRVADNVLSGRAMNMIIADRGGNSRGDWIIERNTSDRVFGSPQGSAVVALGVERIAFRENTQPFAANRNMVGIRFERACGVTVRDNVLAGAVAESRSENPVCERSVEPTHPERPIAAVWPRKVAS